MRRSTLLSSVFALAVTSLCATALAQGAAPPAEQPKPAEPPAGAAPPSGDPAQPPAGDKTKPDEKKKADEKKPAQPPAGQTPAEGQPPTGAAPPGAPAAEPPATQPPSEAPRAAQELPPQPPAAAPPVVDPAAQVTPTHTAAAASPGPDTGVQQTQPEPLPPEMTIGPELFAGMNTRLGGHDSFEGDETVGATFGAGAWFAPNRLFSLGLWYQRTGLGSGETPATDNSISAHYDLNTLWFGGRAFPLRNDDLGLFVALGLGASWQDMSANGTRPTNSFVMPAETFSCSGSDGPSFAIGGGVGVDIDIDRHLAFTAQIDASGHQLTSDNIDGCAVGAGSATNLGGRLGFMYRFDLDDEPRRAAAPSPGVRF